MHKIESGDDPRIKIIVGTQVALYVDNDFIYGCPLPSFSFTEVDRTTAEFYAQLIGAAYRSGRKAGRSKVQHDIRYALGIYK